MNMNHLLVLHVLGVSIVMGYELTKKGVATCDVVTEVNASMSIDFTLIHNSLRGQELASDMLFVEWDSNLANLAQEHANQCRFEHDLIKTCDDKYVGQNIYIKWDSNKYPQFSPFTAVNSWWKERDLYNWETKACSGAHCGHYIQVVKSESKYVGCGISWCPKLLNVRSGRVYDKAVILVCDYSVINNGMDPYTKGPVCSRCNSVVNGFYKCEDKLCKTCDPKTDTECDKCAVKQCQNGGQFNDITCKCDCPKTHYGHSCQTTCKCTDNKSWCPNVKSYCPDPRYAYFLGKECPATCQNLCVSPPQGECLG